jgi:hypothetical protein
MLERQASTVKRVAVAGIAASALLAAPSGASAGTVYSAGYGNAVFTAAPGEKNVLTITFEPSQALLYGYLVFTDEGARITSAVGCQRLSAKSVSCLADTAYADLGDGNDKAVLATPEQEVCTETCGPITSTVRGGPGNDIIVGSPFGDLEYGGDGNDTLIGNAGSDELYGEFGDDKLYASDGFSDRVNCGEGASDSAYRDILDYVLYCENGVLKP